MTSPILNIIKTEWGYLGKRKKLFLFYISLFVIAGIVELATPIIERNPRIKQLKEQNIKSLNNIF